MINLIELADRIETEDIKNLGVVSNVKDAFFGVEHPNEKMLKCSYIHKAFYSDCFTSAKTLHDEILPGWNFEISSHNAIKSVYLYSPDADMNLLTDSKGHHENSTAVAWIAAILRAKALDIK